jgi:hypothetical protein
MKLQVMWNIDFSALIKFLLYFMDLQHLTQHHQIIITVERKLNYKSNQIGASDFSKTECCWDYFLFQYNHHVMMI